MHAAFLYVRQPPDVQESTPQEIACANGGAPAVYKQKQKIEIIYVQHAQLSVQTCTTIPEIFCALYPVQKFTTIDSKMQAFFKHFLNIF